MNFPTADSRQTGQHHAMATFLSSPAAAGARATPGERRFADRLADMLEDDYLCWYDVPVGPQAEDRQTAARLRVKVRLRRARSMRSISSASRKR